MNPTTIEWALNPDGSPGFTSNPFTGCLGPKGDGINCPYCYAKQLANGRLRQRYLDNPNVIDTDFETGRLSTTQKINMMRDPFFPRYWPERLKDLDTRSPRGIFLCDMSDWAAPWIPMQWKEDLMAAIRRNPQHRIYLLTHQPKELQKWSPYPANCWVGVTATDYKAFVTACGYLGSIAHKGQAHLVYLSLEPLLSWEHGDIDFVLDWLMNGCIGWLIIGSMTGRRNDLMHLSNRYPNLTLMPYRKMWTLQPEKEWVKEVVNAADKAQIPVFLKDNLKPLFPETFRDREYAAPPFFTPDWDYRQEMPDRKEK